MSDPSMVQTKRRIPDPEINGKATSTYSRTSRGRRPFSIKNRADLDAAIANGCPRCGYKGPAMKFTNPEQGGRTPPTMVFSSRQQFTKAMKTSTMLCANCHVETYPHHRCNKRAETVGISLANTLAAIAEE